MIIEASPSMRLHEILERHNGAYKDVIPFIWTALQCKRIQHYSNNKYNMDGLFNNCLINTKKWLESDPARTIFRLHKKHTTCCYCGKEIIPTKDSEGDHIVGRENLNGASWQVPCCHTVIGNCQSSKGNRDLFEWWYKKSRSLGTMQKDVLSIYIRGKYRVLKNTNSLELIASEAHHYYLNEIWSAAK